MQPSNKPYILVINGKPEGPFSVEELRERRLLPGDFVKTPDMADYKEAHEIAELRELFHFQKRVVEPQYFAGLDQRLLASALDLLFVSGFYFILGFAAVLVVQDRDAHVLIAACVFTLIPVTNFIYHTVMECSDRQATYGKQVLKIKVCDTEGKRIGVALALGRNFCKLFSAIPFFMGYVISFFNRKQQCLHDIMVGTLVVKERLF